jgi:septum formation protein
LASRSPQRRAILEQLGLSFTVVAPDVEEIEDGGPRELVTENALRKARAVGGERVLGVDTAVVLEQRVYGKPRDEQEARGFLAALSGRTHEVWSGIALIEGENERVAVAVTRVSFRRLTAADIDWYAGTGEWRERAGGYAIQARGAALVEGIEGDYLNVVGLPAAELIRMAPGLLTDP